MPQPAQPPTQASLRKGDNVSAVGVVEALTPTTVHVLFTTGDPVTVSVAVDFTYDKITFVNRPTPSEPQAGSIVEFRKVGTNQRVVVIHSIDPPNKWFAGNDSYNWNQALNAVVNLFGGTDNVEMYVIRDGPQ